MLLTLAFSFPKTLDISGLQAAVYKACLCFNTARRCGLSSEWLIGEMNITLERFNELGEAQDALEVSEFPRLYCIDGACS
jgi:hypothetical protein